MSRYPECPEHCGGEDCIACEIWVERRADERASQYNDPRDYEDEYEHDDWDEDDDEDEEDEETGNYMDPEWDDEREQDTPLGERYASGEDCDFGSFEA